ncbi:MAG: peptide deformylase [Abditibacteriaceae bacterium]
MIRSVVMVPDARLKTMCDAVEEFNSDLADLITDLEDTRASSPGCVGIAAPQIGVLKRVAIVDTSGHKKYGDASSGYLVLINPRLTQRHGRRVGREGCLSLPDFTANVDRAEVVNVEYYNNCGEFCQLVARDFEAVVIQHEIDHLDGILFLDRVVNLKTDVFPRRKK